MSTAAAHCCRGSCRPSERAPPKLSILMTPDPEPLAVVTPNGLYCPPGDFYVDPWQPVKTAVITHGHGDHLRHGSARYILARPGAGIARLRLGGDRDLTPVDYGARTTLGSTTVSLHP